jgi:hypothetical protein
MPVRAIYREQRLDGSSPTPARNRRAPMTPRARVAVGQDHHPPAHHPGRMRDAEQGRTRQATVAALGPSLTPPPIGALHNGAPSLRRP